MWLDLSTNQSSRWKVEISLQVWLIKLWSNFDLLWTAGYCLQQLLCSSFSLHAFTKAILEFAWTNFSVRSDDASARSLAWWIWALSWRFVNILIKELSERTNKIGLWTLQRNFQNGSYTPDSVLGRLQRKEADLYLKAENEFTDEEWLLKTQVPVHTEKGGPK